MFCQSCGTELPDDANFCLKCGAKLPTASRVPQSERVLFERPVSQSQGDELKSVTLIITNKKIRVQWDRHTADTPLSWVKGVETTKGQLGGWWSDHELTIYGVGLFSFDKYEDAVRAAELINSLISP